jgi:flavin reductase (NADH)
MTYASGVGRRRTRQPRSEFGAFLDRQLEQLGLTPAQFADRAHLGLSHVYQILRGDRSDPRGTTLHKVAAALELNETQLPLAGRPSLPEAVETTSLQQGVDRATFFALMSAFPTGVTIVTTLDEHGQPRGLTCTATCSLSADPPLVLVCIDRKSNTLPALRHTRRFVINYLYAGRDALSNRFATRTPDKWRDVGWRPTEHGTPWLYADSLAYAECCVVSEFDGGDHLIVVGRVIGGETAPPGTQPLIYFRRAYTRLANRTPSA